MMWPFIHKTNPRRQIDPIECGAVALGMVLEYFGHYAPNAQLRVDARVSRSGSSASSIVDASARYGLQARAKKVLPSELGRMAAPAILFIDQCHFVVYEGRFLGRYYLNDPARGRYSLDLATFRKRFSKIVITFQKTPSFTTMKPFSQAMMPTSSMAIFLATLGVFSAVAWALLATDIGFFLANTHSATLMISAITMVLVVWGILSSLLLFKAITQAAHARGHEEVSLLERALLAIPYGFFHEVPFFIFANTYASSSTRSLLLVTKTAKKYFFIPFVLVLLTLMFTISWPLAVIAGAAFVLACMQELSKLFFKSSERATAALSQVYEDPSLDRALVQAHDMRAMGQEQLVIDGFLQRYLPRLRAPSSSSVILHFLQSPWLLPVLFLFSLFFYASHLIASGALLWSELFSLVLISFAIFYACARAFSDSGDFDRREHQAFKRELAYVVEEASTKIERAMSDTLIELRDVGFRYRGDESDIFSSLNVALKKAQVIGVVGPPLSGKSTLLGLIGKKMNPTSGELIHFVNQEPFLRIAMIDDDADVFEGSLQANLTLYEANILDADLIDALTKACATDLFYNRPMGLLTPILSGGTNLSTGEKKRLLLAQALVQKPDVIVLDNFFETLDEKTAATILHNLSSSQHVVILTSFRCNELSLCTDVWLMNGHSLVESTHEALFSTSEIYRGIVRQEDEAA